MKYIVPDGGLNRDRSDFECELLVLSQADLCSNHPMLFLSENDVKCVLTLADAIDAVEDGLKARARHRAVDSPRVRTRIPQGSLNILPGAAPEVGVVGFKVNYASQHGSCSHVYIYGSETGELLARIEGNYFFNDARTAAASGVATRHLARVDANVVGQIGAGRQGVGQLEAVCAMRRIHRAQVFARTRDRLGSFCSYMSAKLKIEVNPAPSAEAAVRGADIVNVITTSATPVLQGNWLERGQHVNAAGSNALTRRELDLQAMRRFNVVVVDSRDTARKECGDLLPLVESGLARWETLPEMGEVAAGLRSGRESSEQITLYESHGVAIQDLYVAAKVIERARANGLGREF